MSISKEHISSVLHRMSILVQHKLNDYELDVLADIWFNLFQSCELDRFNEAMRTMARSARSFPLPVDVFEAMDALQLKVERVADGGSQ